MAVMKSKVLPNTTKPPALGDHPPPLPVGLAASATLSPAEALGYGACATLAQLSPAEQLATGVTPLDARDHAISVHGIG